MAFNLKNFANTLSDGTDLPQKWQYKSDTDTLATINNAGYFPSTLGLSVDDTIDIIDSAGVHSRVYVNNVANNVVDVTDGDVVTATDSD